MAKRLSEIVAARVEQAISGLEVIASDKDDVEWEVIPFVALDSTVRWLVGIGLPVPVSGDTVMLFTLLSDPHDKDEVTRIVRAMYAAAVSEAAEATARATSASGGHGRTPGGLLLP